MIEAVVLDLGGVLLDLGASNGLPVGRLDHRGRGALLELLQQEHRRATLEDLDRLLFAPWHEDYARRYARMQEAAWEPHLARLRAELGTSRADLELLGAWFEPYAESIRPIGGAAEALARLAGEGYSLALVSNVPLPGALYRPVLERHGLAAPFALCQWSYDEGSRKPSPKMLLAALSALGCEPARAVMVGDRPASDVAAGLAAGTRTVRVHSHHPPGPLADAEIDALAELPELLSRWAGAA
jgi:HAD superfamily hydrolase (TIGR01549 family)